MARQQDGLAAGGNPSAARPGCWAATRAPPHRAHALALHAQAVLVGSHMRHRQVVAHVEEVVGRQQRPHQQRRRRLCERRWRGDRARQRRVGAHAAAVPACARLPALAAPALCLRGVPPAAPEFIGLAERTSSAGCRAGSAAYGSAAGAAGAPPLSRPMR